MAEIVQSPEVFRILDELTRIEGRANPYPRYARLREISPIVRAEDGALVLTTYAGCSAVLRDPKLGHLPTTVIDQFFPEWRDHPALHTLYTSMLVTNPPDHTRLRRLVSSAFTARRIQALKAQIENTVDELLDAMDGETDFVDAFAFPLPVNVIGEMLGVPKGERAQFQTLVRDFTAIMETITPETLARANPAATTIRDHLGALLDERRVTPRDDLLTALAQAEAEGDRLTRDEAVTTAALLFAAGFETTTNLLANGLAALLEQRKLATLPDVPAQQAVEEVLRFDSPVHIATRLASEPVEIEGIRVSEGERLVAYLGAGNHDPARFDAPGELRLDRADNSPLSFGGGIHYCLGAPLARLEAQIALPAVARRFPRLQKTKSPEQRNSLTLKGYLSFPVHTG